MDGELNMQLIISLLIGFFIQSPTYAMAYVGPGLGAGTISVVLGVLGSIFIALFAIIWYPLKRFLKKIKKSGPQKRTNQ
jgi:hypothetical protein